MKERSLDKCMYCDEKIAELKTDDYVLNFIYGLTRRELAILLKLFAEKRTLDSISKEYMLTRERIREIFVKSIRKIEAWSYKSGLKISEQDLKESIQKNLSSIPFLKTKEIYVLDEEKLRNLSEYTYSATKKDPNLCESSPIDALDLSVRAHNCLINSNIRTIHDLISNSENDIAKIKNLGKKSVNEIVNSVKKLGFEFKWDKYSPDDEK